MRIPRIKGIPCPDALEKEDGNYFLIRHSPTMGSNSEEHYALAENPGRKNMSHEECVEGWLGSTNNLSSQAEGAVKLMRVGDHQTITITPIDPQEIIREAEVWEG